MHGEKKKLPVGVEFFEEIVRGNFYYADKTGMIAELLNSGGKVNLFTRPRRFGKSLNMSMIKSFFETGCDRQLFQKMKIAEETEICENYMGQFPVISISLKGVSGLNFESARRSGCTSGGLLVEYEWKCDRTSFY